MGYVVVMSSGRRKCRSSGWLSGMGLGMFVFEFCMNFFLVVFKEGYED